MLGDLGKLIVAKGFKNLPKVQKIARSGHTERGKQFNFNAKIRSFADLATYAKKYPQNLDLQ